MRGGTELSTQKNVSEQQLQTQFTYIDAVARLNGGKCLKAYTHTFGCQQNEADTERIRGMLHEMGYEMTDSTEEADFILFNTCAVREHAEDRAFGNIGALSHLKKKRPDVVIALCGCMAQQEKNVEKIKKSYPQVNLLFGTHALWRFPSLLYRVLTDRKRVFDIGGEDDIAEGLPVLRAKGAKAWLSIMYGCNNFCTYCIVPYVRGRERSRYPEEIEKELRELVAAGYREITLLGQNVNSYGKNLENPITFAQLLEKIEQIEGLERIRFMTSHPKDLSDELIEVMGKSKKICKHLHLPVQSGSSKILKKMNRHYTKEQYLELVEKIRRSVPDVSLTTDIIVGFPGETEEDFEETMDIVRKVRYDSAFTFIYSKRTGTPAAVMEDQVPEDVVKNRFDRLLKEVHSIASEVCSVHEGTVQTALIESVSEHDPSMVTGRLSNNLLVHIKGDKGMIGRLADVRLTECKGFYYLGELAE